MARPMAEGRLGVVHGSGEGVQHARRPVAEAGLPGRLPDPGLAQLADEVVLGVPLAGLGAAVQDERLGPTPAQSSMWRRRLASWSARGEKARS